MKIINLKKMSLPKVAVLATGAVGALLVATISPATVASAHVGYTQACNSCHSAGGSVKATPAAGTKLPGASYNVVLAFTGGSSPSGFWISGNGVNVTGASSTSATMTAPAAAGTYTYAVWVRAGVVASTTYSITVAAAPTTTTTTPPPTTTTPPITTTTTRPPTTTTTTRPPTTTTAPPVTTTTAPPVTTTTAPPVSSASIRSLSPTHGAVGTRVTIRGAGFGTPGVVKFGAVTARVSSWTRTSITVTVPATNYVSVRSDDGDSVLGSGVVSVTVTPKGAAASNAMGFRIESSHHDD